MSKYSIFHDVKWDMQVDGKYEHSEDLLRVRKLRIHAPSFTDTEDSTQFFYYFNRANNLQWLEMTNLRKVRPEVSKRLKFLKSIHRPRLSVRHLKISFSDVCESTERFAYELQRIFPNLHTVSVHWTVVDATFSDTTRIDVLELLFRGPWQSLLKMVEVPSIALMNLPESVVTKKNSFLFANSWKTIRICDPILAMQVNHMERFHRTACKAICEWRKLDAPKRVYFESVGMSPVLKEACAYGAIVMEGGDDDSHARGRAYWSLLYLVYMWTMPHKRVNGIRGMPVDLTRKLKGFLLL
jgi:hypothetical protein